MTPIERMEELREKAKNRGDHWEAEELQKTIDDWRAAIRCEGCGAILALEVLPSGNRYVSVWTDYLGNTSHFNPTGGIPLLVSHSPEGSADGNPQT